MNAKQQCGLVIVVVSLHLGVWTVIRLTGIAAQMRTWVPPFDVFQVHTAIIGFIAFLLLIMGVLMVGGEKVNEKKAGQTSS